MRGAFCLYRNPQQRACGLGLGKPKLWAPLQTLHHRDNGNAFRMKTAKTARCPNVLQRPSHHSRLASLTFVFQKIHICLHSFACVLNNTCHIFSLINKVKHVQGRFRGGNRKSQRQPLSPQWLRSGLWIQSSSDQIWSHHCKASCRIFNFSGTVSSFASEIDDAASQPLSQGPYPSVWGLVR